MNLARYLVQGVDVWMNTPRRPTRRPALRQKAALNGVLNFSVLDGCMWRRRLTDETAGPLAMKSITPITTAKDQKDAESLYDTLENEIIPLYYQERSADNLPIEWIGRIKECMRTLGPQFGMRRMVKEYTNELYLPAREDFIY